MKGVNLRISERESGVEVWEVVMELVETGK